MANVDVNGMAASNGDILKFRDDSALHTIKGEDGTTYAHRNNIKFVNATITDDAENDTTIITAEGGTTICQIPTFSGDTFTYNGSAQGPTITGLDTDTMIATNVTATDAGSYVATIELKNTRKMVWSDMTTAPKTFNYSINKVTVTLPAVTNTSKTYNGLEQSPTIASYDSTKLTVSGNTATNAGDYTVVFSLIDSTNYEMSGTNNIPWSIAKATQTLSPSSSSAVLDDSHPVSTIIINGAMTNLSAVSSDTSVATVSVNYRALTITGITDGTATITVTAEETNNYYSATTTISVTASDMLTIVTFTNGTDKQIKDMLDAYYADKITWAKMGWAVGDTRTIHLDEMQAPNPNSDNTWAAQDITIVIVAHDHDDLATPINGHSKACITVQTREVMNNNNSSDNTTGHIYVDGNSWYDYTFYKWSDLYMRTYLNNTVLDAIPSGDFKSSIKQCTHYRHTYINTVDDELVTDTLFLPSFPEVFGTETWNRYQPTTHGEGTQWDYYQTSANRIKKGNNNGNANNIAQEWWTSSASAYHEVISDGYYWLRVRTEGQKGNIDGATACALAPAWGM